MALVRERTIPTERPPPVGEVSANFVWTYDKTTIMVGFSHGHTVLSDRCGTAAHNRYKEIGGILHPPEMAILVMRKLTPVTVCHMFTWPSVTSAEHWTDTSVSTSCLWLSPASFTPWTKSGHFVHSVYDNVYIGNGQLLCIIATLH